MTTTTADVQVYVDRSAGREATTFTVDVIHQNDVWIVHGTLRGLQETRVDSSRFTVTHQPSGKAFANFPPEHAKAVCDWLAERLPAFDMATFKELPAPMKRELGKLIRKYGGRI